MDRVIQDNPYFGSVENQWGFNYKLRGKRVLFDGKRIYQSNSKCSTTDTNI